MFVITARLTGLPSRTHFFEEELILKVSVYRLKSRLDTNNPDLVTWKTRMQMAQNAAHRERRNTLKRKLGEMV